MTMMMMMIDYFKDLEVKFRHRQFDMDTGQYEADAQFAAPTSQLPQNPRANERERAKWLRQF